MTTETHDAVMLYMLEVLGKIRPEGFDHYQPLFGGLFFG
jgi:hypothetical protein